MNLGTALLVQPDAEAHHGADVTESLLTEEIRALPLRPDRVVRAQPTLMTALKSLAHSSTQPSSVTRPPGFML